MNIAEMCGGVGIAIMMHKTAFETETENLSKLLDKLGDRLEKFTQGDLRKRVRSTNAADLLAELGGLVALLEEAHEVVKRRGDALPEFRAWVLNQPVYDRGANLLLVDKAADSYSGDTSAMIETGALRRFYQPTTPSIDLGDAASAATVRHRHDNNGV